ncbi:MAG: dihydroorotate dehydrogenase electron transfer subunit [Clostridiales Family XIII bacterium]|jgi:dihydroorotate dehydrogenase electron transfer subunit|nr:dihydroorotate dehydrogenase electron transfer subunit [Clostridiales Family XIII bacterium]
MTVGGLKENGIRRAEIIEHIPLASQVFQLKLHAPDVAAVAVPGQFVNVYLNDAAMLLPRPIGVADATDAQVTLIYAVAGRGTELLSRYASGTCVRLLGPNGNGYNLGAIGAHALLIGGGLGVPPLLFAAKRIRERGGARITAVLGYKDEPYCLRGMKLFCDSVYGISERAAPVSELSARASGTEAAGSEPKCDGKTGNVMDLLTSTEVGEELDAGNATVLSCGPAPMLRAVARWAQMRGIRAQVSLEERMGCGYGACVCCTCAVKPREEPAGGREASADETAGRTDLNGGIGGRFESEGERRGLVRRKVCTDGPVFQSDEIVWGDD